MRLSPLLRNLRISDTRSLYLRISVISEALSKNDELQISYADIVKDNRKCVEKSDSLVIIKSDYFEIFQRLFGRVEKKIRFC
jgi:hypothetical protein